MSGDGDDGKSTEENIKVEIGFGRGLDCGAVVPDVELTRGISAARGLWCRISTRQRGKKGGVEK